MTFMWWLALIVFGGFTVLYTIDTLRKLLSLRYTMGIFVTLLRLGIIAGSSWLAILSWQHIS